MTEPEYLYPTEPGWQEPMRDGWKASNRPYFQFCFLKFYPHTLPESGPYWVYFYYTTKSTEREWEKRAVLFRVHVRAHYRSPAQDRSDTYTFRVPLLYRHPYCKSAVCTVKNWWLYPGAQLLKPCLDSRLNHRL